MFEAKGLTQWTKMCCSENRKNYTIHGRSEGYQLTSNTCLYTHTYSRSPLIQHPWDWTGDRQFIQYSRISNSTNTDLSSYMLTFLLLLLYVGRKTNHRSIPLGYFLQLLVLGQYAIRKLPNQSKSPKNR